MKSVRSRFLDEPSPQRGVDVMAQTQMDPRLLGMAAAEMVVAGLAHEQDPVAAQDTLDLLEGRRQGR